MTIWKKACGLHFYDRYSQNQDMGWKRAGLMRLGHASARFWLGVAAGCCWAAPLVAWEGHDWNQWKQVTTWYKPQLTSDQVGRSELVPVLGETNRAESAKAWEDRRKKFAFAISQVLGVPTNLSPPALEVRELGADELEGYSRRHLLIRSEMDDWIPAYLLLPNPPPTNRIPAVLCLH